jgi:hypothetical protein
MATIIVGGAIANKYRQGGEAWVRLSWLLGFRRLGHEAHLVEQIDPVLCSDAAGRPAPFERSVQRDYFQSVMQSFDLTSVATLVLGDGDQTCGLPFRELLDLMRCADLLVNISGHVTAPPLLRAPRLRAYVDIDPGFTQFWHAEGNPGARLAGHDMFFTIGENIGTPACPIPTGGIPWRPTRQPVVLDDWPVLPPPPPDARRFTTVANWRGPFGPVQFAGRTFGLKVHEFRKFLTLPRLTSLPFEIALGIHPADGKDLDALRAHGWRIEDPSAVAADPLRFRAYVQGSAAEFSVAQGIYVDTNCGWFSDRTVRYLASGRPALVQETGASLHVPSGAGFVTFRTLEEAAAGARAIWGDYERHCRAARVIAETYFDSNLTLGTLLDAVDSARARTGA